SRSWRFARWTTTASTNPSVSTKIWRLTPLIFFPRVVPSCAGGPGRLDGLAVDAAGARFRSLADLLADLPPQRIVDLVPPPATAPAVEVVSHRSFGGKS